MRQSEEARKALVADLHPLEQAIGKFTTFYGKDRNATVWGNGCMFDNVILKNAYKAAGFHVPWGYGQDRDVRTLVQLGNLVGFQKTKEFKGTQHNALDDAKHQVRYCHNIWKHIKEHQA